MQCINISFLQPYIKKSFNIRSGPDDLSVFTFYMLSIPHHVNVYFNERVRNVIVRRNIGTLLMKPFAVTVRSLLKLVL